MQREELYRRLLFDEVDFDPPGRPATCQNRVADAGRAPGSGPEFWH